MLKLQQKSPMIFHQSFQNLTIQQNPKNQQYKYNIDKEKHLKYPIFNLSNIRPFCPEIAVR